VLEGEPHVLLVRVLGVGWVIEEVRQEEHVVPLDLVSALLDVGTGNRSGLRFTRVGGALLPNSIGAPASQKAFATSVLTFTCCRNAAGGLRRNGARTTTVRLDKASLLFLPWPNTFFWAMVVSSCRWSAVLIRV
jgi:hypothetical protein